MVNCSVYGCSKRTGSALVRDLGIVLHRFPKTPIDRHEKWIHFCRRKNPDGSKWMPNDSSRICSLHFEGGVKSGHPQHPGFDPSIFSSTWPVSTPNIDKFQRVQSRGVKRKKPEFVEASTQTTESCHGQLPMFSCIMFNDKKEASTQINHFQSPHSQVSSHIVSSTDKPCNVGFHGYDSLTSDRICTTQTGCTLRIFNILLQIIKPDFPHRLLSPENSLTLTLMKLKQDKSYTAVGDFFNIDRRAAQRIFATVLEVLTFRTRNLIRWPSRDEIKKDLPEVFRTDFPSTKAILDCTEMKIEVPSSLYIRNHCYSNYKSDHTIKYLIAVAPNGTTTFISKGYGGRASDVHITNTCGILDLFQPGDTVLADKGFPQIQVDKVVTVIPPRARPDQKQFTPKQMEMTRKIARARVHVERKIQRMKLFKILTNRMDYNLLPYADKIFHVITVISNFTPPIIANE